MIFNMSNTVSGGGESPMFPLLTSGSGAADIYFTNESPSTYPPPNAVTEAKAGTIVYVCFKGSTRINVKYTAEQGRFSTTGDPLTVKPVMTYVTSFRMAWGGIEAYLG